MATKAQLINFIMDTFKESNGESISKVKLDRFKKAELEIFIKVRRLEAELNDWLAAQN